MTCMTSIRSRYARVWQTRNSLAPILAAECYFCHSLRQKYGVAGARDAFEEERQRAAARTSVKRQAELAAVVDEQSWSVIHASSSCGHAQSCDCTRWCMQPSMLNTTQEALA